MDLDNCFITLGIVDVDQKLSATVALLTVLMISALCSV